MATAGQRDCDAVSTDCVLVNEPDPEDSIALRRRLSSEQFTSIPSATLSSGGSLRNDQTLVSTNGQARFVVQPDGNMVVYRLDNEVLWGSKRVE